MNLDKFTGSGSTPSRRAFWDKVSEALLASQKREGRNASVDEHQGQGTVINFPDQTPSSAFDCSIPLSITFSSVEFDCGCVELGQLGTDSIIITDGGSFNDIEQALVSEPDTCPPNCFWEEDYDVEQLFVHAQRWLGTSNTCEGDPTDEVDLGLGGLFIVREPSGLWHVWAEVHFTDTVIFYGTTMDISSPISNTLECSSTHITFDNAVTDCVYAGPVDFTVSGHGGTAQINML